MKMNKHMRTPDEVVTRMIGLAEKRYNCSQILMALFLEQEKKENPDLLRAMAGLGDGCGFFNETCGIMTGGASVLAFYRGKGSDNEIESDHLLPMLEDLGDWFRGKTKKKFNGTRCRDIAGDLVGTPEVKQICGGLIFETYNKINEILTAYAGD
jgi:C_GCAxxG_C_C family probable redox protein